MYNHFYALQQQRRSIYHLGKESALEQNQLIDLIKNSIREAPSAFHSQSSRAVILLGEEHDRLWEIALYTLKKILPEEAFAQTEAKINHSFKAGLGTVLFYEDQTVVQDLQTRFALYADNFPIWSEQASGMAQYAVWLALSEAGLGASLQHYNPLIDEAVAENWRINANWRLRGQMPFGSIETAPEAKEHLSDKERFRVFS